jgi:hypothetical protein
MRHMSKTWHDDTASCALAGLPLGCRAIAAMSDTLGQTSNVRQQMPEGRVSGSEMWARPHA